MRKTMDGKPKTNKKENERIGKHIFHVVADIASLSP